MRRESEIAKDPIALSHALYRRAGLLRNRGHYEEAKQLYHESLQLNQLAANLQGQAASLHQHATMELAQGNPAEARQLLLRSLGIAETIDDQHGQAASLHQLAIIELAQGNPSEARRLLEQSLSMKEHIGDWRGYAASLHELARIESAQGNPAKARRLLQHSQGIFERLGDLRSQGGSMHELARIESGQGNLTEARRLRQHSLRIFEGLGDLQGQAAALHELARIESAQGNLAEARRLLQRSQTIREAFGDVQGQAASLHEMAIIEQAEGNPAEARRLWERSIASSTRSAMSLEGRRLLECSRNSRRLRVTSSLPLQWYASHSGYSRASVVRWRPRRALSSHGSRPMQRATLSRGRRSTRRTATRMKRGMKQEVLTMFLGDERRNVFLPLSETGIPAETVQRLEALGITTLEELRDTWTYGNRQLLTDYLGESPVRFTMVRPSATFTRSTAAGPGQSVNLLASGPVRPLVLHVRGLTLRGSKLILT